MKTVDTNSQKKRSGTLFIVLLFVLVLALSTGWLFLGRPKFAAAAQRPSHLPQTASTSPASPPPASPPPPAPLAERQVGSGHKVMQSVTFSPDGSLLAAVADEKILYLVDAHTGVVKQQIAEDCCTMASVAFSPDGTRIALGLNDAKGARIRILSAQNGTLQTLGSDIHEEGNLVHSVQFSSSGQQLLTEIDSDAVLWDLENNSSLKRFEAGPNGICMLSADQATVITAGSNANDVKLWDVASGAARFILTAHTEGLLAVAISPDGATSATGGYDSTARVWDNRTGTLKLTLQHGEGNAVSAVAFSHAGMQLATAGSAVSVWNTTSGARHWLWHRDNVQSLAFSPDDHMLAGASRDGQLYLWQMP